MKKIFPMVLAISIASVGTLTAQERHEKVLFPFGNIPLRVVVEGRGDAQSAGDIAAVSEEAKRLGNVFDVHRTDSEISMLNEGANIAMFWPSEEVNSVLGVSRKWNRRSGGAFDPTVLPVISVWSDAAKTGKVPSDESIAKALRLVGMEKVKSVDYGKVSFAVKGMGLDFGGIAKGYISDRLAAMLKERGVARGIVETGGDAYSFGKGLFKFGIRDPQASSRDKMMASIEVSEGAVVTSGSYERSIEIGGKRYHHIFDPRTGRPVKNGIVSVTITGGPAADADAIATAVVVKGLEDGKRLIAAQKGISAVIVNVEGERREAWVSKALSPYIQPSDEWKDLLKTF